MAINLSTGICGFICSATKKAGEYVSTFVSGATGWMIRNNGDAEFKSIYVRDKITTNEFVYNRIRVTEDEQILSSSIKVLSFVQNVDGSYTIHPDLRDGDINPLAKDDLIIGYYYSPNNSGVIYSIQKMHVRYDPAADQSITVACEEGCQPYQHLILVRVGNLSNEERQSFIKLSSRTNCQYFYHGINSWEAFDNPDNIRCVVGKADVGLIPAWASKFVGKINHWFGLIADGVVLRGTFILQSSGKKVEDELDGINTTIKETQTRFEVREGLIGSKVTEVIKYSESAATSVTKASNSAQDASKSANNAEEAKVIAVEKASEAEQTANGFKQTVTETTTTILNASNQVKDAVGNAQSAASSAANSAQTAITKASEAEQTANGFKQTVTETTTKAVNDAVSGADAAITEKVGTAVTQSAKQWKIEVMGTDSQGNPNTVLTAINADSSGIKIKGEKIEIDGKLLAKIIETSGLDITGDFVTQKYAIQINISAADNDQRLNLYALKTYGSVFMKQGYYDRWNTPGVLMAMAIKVSTTAIDLTNGWWGPIGGGKFARLEPGVYKITHNLGHDTYTVSVTPASISPDGNYDRLIASIVEKTSSYLTVRVIDVNGTKLDATLYVAMFGRN